MWIIYALLTALFLATSDALTKHVLVSKDEYFVAWARLLFALPILLITLFFIRWPLLNGTFWIATACALPLEIGAVILYTKALKVSPISLTIPFLAFTPLFIILTSYLLLGEKISSRGGAGILLIAAGSYALNIHKAKESIYDPIKAIFKEKGALMMIMVAFLYSFTSTLGKMAIENSSPIFFGSFYFILLTVLFTPIALTKNKDKIVFTKRDIRALIFIGISYSLMIIFHMLAMSLTTVAYMISIKRISLIFSIVYGHILFKEERMSERLFGGMVMLVGFALIVLYS